MSQSGIPARCNCGEVGPPRGPKAIAAGWTCTRKWDGPSVWTCLACVAQADAAPVLDEARNLPSDKRAKLPRSMRSSLAMIGFLAAVMALDDPRGL